MSQHYSDPTRADAQYALPNVEVFYMSQGEIDDLARDDEDTELHEQGWYYWYCFPGCLPDSDPIGPFTSEQLAIDAAKEPGEDVTDAHWREDGDDTELFRGGY